MEIRPANADVGESATEPTAQSAGGRYWVRTSDLFGVNEARYHCANRPLRGKNLVGEHLGVHQLPASVRPRPVGRGRHWDRTSDLFRVREARYRCASRPRWRRDLNPCTRICSPLPRLSATPPARAGLVDEPLRPSPSGRRDSNPRPSPWQGDALPTEPRPHRKSRSGVKCECNLNPGVGQLAKHG